MRRNVSHGGTARDMERGAVTMIVRGGSHSSHADAAAGPMTTEPDPTQVVAACTRVNVDSACSVAT